MTPSPPRSVPGARRGPIPQWAERLTWLFDEAVRIPGTNIRVGLDAVLGFVAPAAGDVLTALAALSLVGLAIRRGLPRGVVLRMLGNVAVDMLVGQIPLLGDLADIRMRANRRNLELLKSAEGHTQPRPRRAEAILLAGAALLLLGLAALLTWAVWLLIAWLGAQLG